MALPAHLHRAVQEVVKLDVLAGVLVRNSTALEDDLLAVTRQRELSADVALLSMAENIGQARWRQVQLALKVFELRRRHGEAFVEALDKAWKEGVGSSGDTEFPLSNVSTSL